MRGVVVVLLACALALGLAACGKRGALRPPPPENEQQSTLVAPGAPGPLVHAGLRA